MVVLVIMKKSVISTIMQKVIENYVIDIIMNNQQIIHTSVCFQHTQGLKPT